jgi:hypothetical protein
MGGKRGETGKAGEGPQGATPQAWLQAAAEGGLIGPRGLLQEEKARGAAQLLYPSSLCREDGLQYALLRLPGSSGGAGWFARGRALGIFGSGRGLPRPAEEFEGEEIAFEHPAAGSGGMRVRFCPLSHANAIALRRVLPFCAPSPLARQETTIGLGDRLGVAGPGHIRTVRLYRASPVLAQQSVRELELTGRSYEQVLDASTWAVFQEGYRHPWGADGDHLKTEEWVRTALRLGFTMITADVSDYIRNEYAGAAGTEVMAHYGRLPESYRRRVEGAYLSLRLKVGEGLAVTFSPETLARTALVYGEAIEHAARLYRAAAEESPGGRFDFELSVDETQTPTTPEAHAFVALEARAAGLRLSSLAPRFVGEFQKGIDYIGSVSEFERSLAAHAALARHFGYRLSVHSGSDKFSVFPAVGRLTGGRFHLKTAGTSWLEAVKLMARLEPALYRRLHRAALERFDAATRYYHVSTDLARVPSLEGLEDGELPGLFDNPDARQLIHITYGELLRDPSLGPELCAALQRHQEAYWEALQIHIGRHLSTLAVPARKRG